MAYKLLYFETVKTDVKEAKEWYRKQRKGLEKEFSIAIKDAIINISLRPFTYSIRYKNVRIAHPNTFPYSIHYYIDETEKFVVITAIVHDRRKPDIAEGRF